MVLSELHFLLTYQCLMECDHCFAWGSPRSSGVWNTHNLQKALDNAITLESIETIYFEGGEPFLYFPILLFGLKEAKARGFRVGIVTYPYWAQTGDDAKEWLRPIAEVGISDLAVSGDCFHGEAVDDIEQKNAIAAARELEIPIGVMAAEEEETDHLASITGGEVGYTKVMYRGRAAVELAPKVTSDKHSWEKLTECPFEPLTDPQRFHVDPYGNLHICQGISIGNILKKPLSEIMSRFEPHKHPILRHLIKGGPAALVREFDLSLSGTFADACELCYRARLSLRSEFPTILHPDQMYGQF